MKEVTIEISLGEVNTFGDISGLVLQHCDALVMVKKNSAFKLRSSEYFPIQPVDAFPKLFYKDHINS